MTATAKFTIQLVFGVVIVLGVMPSVSAQTQAERERAENERELEIRIWNLRSLSEQSRRFRKKPRNVQLALAQMQEDFTRLQIANKRLGRAAIANSALDLKFVSKSAAEIKKRAERLNTNLALPKPDVGDRPSTTDPIAGPEQIKSSILRLARVVFRFVDNPFFKEVSVVDTQLTTVASRDLQEIIGLSEQLKKDSDRFESARGKKVP